jgi:hypothetical protein
MLALDEPAVGIGDDELGGRAGAQNDHASAVGRRPSGAGCSLHDPSSQQPSSDNVKPECHAWTSPRPGDHSARPIEIPGSRSTAASAVQ